MGTTKYFTIGLMAFFLLVGCKKDDGLVTFSLQTSNYQSQEKTHMEYANGVYYTCWNDGDQIKINGATATVSNGSTTISVDQASDYYAVYPSSCVTGSATSSTSITLPRVYEYMTDNNGRQIIGAPMAAKAVSGNNGQILFFKNLCTLLKIHVTNNVTVNNINIHSSATPLSGSATVAIIGPGENQITMSMESEDKNVSLFFPSGCPTGSGSGKDFYIPIPALPQGETLHVALVATLSTGQKNVYLRSTTVNNEHGLPANMVISLNVFETVSPYLVANCVTYIMGHRGEVVNGSYLRPYINTGIKANQGTTIEMGLSPKNEQLSLESYTPFLYGQNGGLNTSNMFYLWNAPANPSSPNADIAQTGSKRDNPQAGFISAQSSNLEHRYSITHSPSSLVIRDHTAGTSITNSHSGTPSTYSSEKPIYLMWAANENQNRKFMGKCYYFRVSDASGMLFNGIPTTVEVSKFNTFLSSGLASGNSATAGVVPCLYDMVSGKFFSTATQNVHFYYGSTNLGSSEYTTPEIDKL